jgi:putative CocE/NonD family hydrolase
MNVRLWLVIPLVIVIVLSAGPGFAGDQNHPVREQYTKVETTIAMRDGVRLFTVVYTPNDAGPDRRYPILMIRTPYSCGPYGADRYAEQLGPHPSFVDDGYIFVCQDVRGRFMSEGEFVNMRPHRSQVEGVEVDESTDTWDSIDWLISSLPHTNGRVGLWGNSYPGFYTSTGIIDSHPALAAAMPSAPIADWFWDDMHHHGAFSLILSFNFFSSFGVARPEPTTEWPERFDHGTPDGYRFFLELGPLATINDEILNREIDFWNDIVAHPNYDAFWQSRNILPHLAGITCPVLVVGGLFDAEDLYGPFETYAAIENLNPEADNALVMGPWRHGGWLRQDGRTLGDADFGMATGEWFRQSIMLPFFRAHLKGEGAVDHAEATVFETGANRWRRFDQWPPADLESRALYLTADERAVFDPPKGESATGAAEFVSDPEHPVPYTQTITARWHAEYMVEDQRFAAARPDVLTFRSEPLAEDLTVAGPIEVHLHVSTTAQDADWVVKLIDEFPGRLPGYEPPKSWRDTGEPDFGGTMRMVRSEVFRGRFRNSYEHPEPFVPDAVTRVSFPLQDVLHTFKKGHRITIQVQSSLFPFIDRNPQGWVDNIFEATASDFAKATHRVHQTDGHRSRLVLGILAQPLTEDGGR